MFIAHKSPAIKFFTADFCQDIQIEHNETVRNGWMRI